MNPVHQWPRLTALMVLASVGAAAVPALADPIVPAVAACATVNCKALSLPGRINPHPETPALASPWVEQVVAVADKCLRVQVVEQSADLSISVVAPDGTVYTNADGSLAPCPTCPKVEVKGTRNGAYTIILNAKGGAGREATFILRTGLYQKGSVNCAAPTKGS